MRLNTNGQISCKDTKNTLCRPRSFSLMLREGYVTRPRDSYSSCRRTDLVADEIVELVRFKCAPYDDRERRHLRDAFIDSPRPLSTRESMPSNLICRAELETRAPVRVRKNEAKPPRCFR